MATLARVPEGVSAGGQFTTMARPEPTCGLASPTKVEPVDTSYRVFHQAPTNDGFSSSLDRLADSFGPDVYEHPEFHGSGESDPETMAQLTSTRGNPEATVTIYRAVPAGVRDINPGDWVTLSRHYAEQHAMQDADESNDWPIIQQQVRAGDVWTDGNDLAEYGYDPAPASTPAQDGLSELEALATRGKTSPDAEATLAVLRGTARKELVDRFSRSGLDYGSLATAVGHSPRVARRVVQGKEPLNETTVSAYFRALAST